VTDHLIDVREVVSRFDVKPNLIKTIWRECQPKLLVVTDNLSFATTSGFGLSQFVSTLATGAIHGMLPQVVKARRGTADPDADLSNFRFDDATHGLTKSRYDVVFLFGINSEGVAQLPAAEVDAIARFMQAGGGVFATGDHESLGAALSRDIPRVRNMRYWKQSETPNVSNATRLSTNLSGDDETEEFADQSDRHPQRLYLNFTTLAGGVGNPHPLLQAPGPRRAIEVFPDHPHEGECRVPSDLSTQFTMLDGTSHPEWPSGVAPEIVAMAMSHGDGFAAGPTGPKVPLAPRSFIAICAYNGQQAGVGRVATDSTWHHFVNINLDGTGEPGMSALKNADGTDSESLTRVRQYYRNLATWLMPRNVRRCLRIPLLVEELRRFPLFEELVVPGHRKIEAADLMRIGEQVAASLGRHMPAWEVEAMLADALEDGVGEKGAALIQQPRAGIGMPLQRDLAVAALGGVTLGLLETLEAHRDVETLDPHKSFDAETVRGARGAASKVLHHQREELGRLDALLREVHQGCES